MQGSNKENPVSKLYRGSCFGTDPNWTSSSSGDDVPSECPPQAQRASLRGRLVIYPLSAYLESQKPLAAPL